MSRYRCGRWLGIPLVVLVASTLMGSHGRCEAPASPAANMGRLGWLKGCWFRETKANIVEEQWMAPRGGAMLGMGRTVSKVDNQVAEYEAMRIEERDGKLVFTAKPSGQDEGSFVSIELTDSLVIFENAEHDFPQRVGYRLRSNGRLEAWIEGRKPQAAQDSQPRRIEYPYRRVRCPQ